LLEVPTNSEDTGTETLTPLVDRSINDTLLEVNPFLDQALLEVLDVSYHRPIHPFLQHSPDLVVHWIKVWTVWWPECWRDESWSIAS
jgi:hypothetical protein